jgi:hypothetical protein
MRKGLLFAESKETAGDNCQGSSSLRKECKGLLSGGTQHTPKELHIEAGTGLSI